MPDDTFAELKDQLLASGVAPRHVRRIVAELDDHVSDLVSEALARGDSRESARDFALRRIGNQSLIAERMLEDAALKTWIYRYPRIARIYLPVAYALLLPAAPLFAGMANPGIVARWGAALMLSAGITALMFLSMQLAIVLT
jgi:hypothetical protein